MTTIESLFPHQRALVEEYRSGSAPRVVALDAPPGTGKSRTLAVIAAERAAEGGLVIVVTPPALVSQWTQVVRDVGAAPVAVYASPADFRLALDSGPAPWPASGIVICGSSVVRTPLATKTLSSASPSLLVVDEVSVSRGSDLGRSLRAVADRAHQVIFTAGRPDAWFPASETRRWTFPLADNQGRRIAPHFSVRVHDYTGDQAEAEVVREAIDLLRQVDYPLPALLLTRTAIQFALLRLVQRLETPEQLSPWEEGKKDSETGRTWSPAIDRPVAEVIWNLLDRFDDLEPDRRLLTALEETRSATDEGRPLVIATGLAQEVDYLVAGISSPRVSISTVTARTPAEERLAATERLRMGNVLVVTDAFFAAMQMPLPDGTRSIWFMPPRSQRQTRQRLGLGMTSNGVEIVLLRAIPSVTPADELVGQIQRTLQNPWQEHPGLLEDSIWPI
jgi:hypothetical protein